MFFYTYILFSATLNRYYSGSTNNLERRLFEHNSGQNNSTKHGTPWTLVFSSSFNSRTEALQKEMEIKNRGAKRFLAAQDILPG
ncbi:MAG: GIY-YIG nuclease family protein [Ignavibacteria bacterium]|nr:GIY-YIG nuclease family protein [Ignavibacteria bacterium]